MTDRPELGPLYRQTRLHTMALVSEADGCGEVPVPATPEWTVHDVLAHLVGITVGAAGPVPPGGPSEEWTARQVAWGRSMRLDELLATWEESGPAFEAVVDRPQAVIDAVTHEYDLRGALARPGDRERRGDALGQSAAARRGQRHPHRSSSAPRTATHAARSIGDEPTSGEPVVLTTSVFELFRWRMGRRSRAQMAAMDWSGDPEPFLDHLAVFGPSARRHRRVTPPFS